ncbi:MULTISPECIES: nitrile hydratase subunit beta [Amycolatopsis methanolica group]|uniref:Nitrile hydratase subunit beta n=1 Tax=Amycolatopsis methanolica 239 TaxID=1068978 RepID=A0A076N1L4_AMYME|nr:nitrile hydratase subunit beta [Amycolatopsis methanolica]AIJ24700.1 beta subunit of nitrile hydratase [Amycolatopsis methanolica 239]
MNGVFDLGGTDGLGPVVVEENEPVFHAEWEKAAFAMFASSFRAGLFGVDQFRHAIELMDPAEYLLSNYYEHWAHAVQYYAEKQGLIDAAELAERTQYYLDNPDAPLPEREDPELLEFCDLAVKHGAPANRESGKVAAFKVGDLVTVADDSPIGHTRKARYVRGRTGVITGAHGTFIYPDSAGNGHGDAPEHLYTVRFTAKELWGEDVADPNGASYFDVWEPYLTLAENQGAH